MGFFVAVAARVVLQEVTASAGRECGLYPKLYILHMLDGNAASARAVQTDLLLKTGIGNSKGESLPLLLVCLACTLSRLCVLSKD